MTFSWFQNLTHFPFTSSISLSDKCCVHLCLRALEYPFFPFSLLSSSTGLCNFPQRQLGLLDFFHLSSSTRFAEHYSKMTSKKQGKYILYVKKEPKTKKHRCSNISCWIFLILFFCSTFYFLTAHKTFLSENICAMLWIYVRRIPLYFQYT